MEKQEYVGALQRVLDSISVTMDNVKRCLYADDKDRLKKAQSQFKEVLVTSLPLVDRLTLQVQKNELEKRLLMLVPALQGIAQAMETVLARTKIKCDSAILFTEKGMGELAQVFSSAGELARDTKDSLATGNPHLKSHARAEMERITLMVDNFCIEHQQRLITGACTPRASYLYIDMMDGLRRLARELAYLAENA